MHCSETVGLNCVSGVLMALLSRSSIKKKIYIYYVKWRTSHSESFFLPANSVIELEVSGFGNICGQTH